MNQSKFLSRQAIRSHQTDVGFQNAFDRRVDQCFIDNKSWIVYLYNNRSDENLLKIIKKIRKLLKNINFKLTLTVDGNNELVFGYDKRSSQKNFNEYLAQYITHTLKFFFEDIGFESASLLIQALNSDISVIDLSIYSDHITNLDIEDKKVLKASNRAIVDLLPHKFCFNSGNLETYPENDYDLITGKDYHLLKQNLGKYSVNQQLDSMDFASVVYAHIAKKLKIDYTYESFWSNQAIMPIHLIHYPFDWQELNNKNVNYICSHENSNVIMNAIKTLSLNNPAYLFFGDHSHWVACALVPLADGNINLYTFDSKQESMSNGKRITPNNVKSRWLQRYIRDLKTTLSLYKNNNGQDLFKIAKIQDLSVGVQNDNNCGLAAALFVGCFFDMYNHLSLDKELSPYDYCDTIEREFDQEYTKNGLKRHPTAKDCKLKINELYEVIFGYPPQAINQQTSQANSSKTYKKVKGKEKEDEIIPLPNYDDLPQLKSDLYLINNHSIFKEIITSKNDEALIKALAKLRNLIIECKIQITVKSQADALVTFDTKASNSFDAKASNSVRTSRDDYIKQILNHLFTEIGLDNANQLKDWFDSKEQLSSELVSACKTCVSTLNKAALDVSKIDENLRHDIISSNNSFVAKDLEHFDDVYTYSVNELKKTQNNQYIYYNNDQFSLSDIIATAITREAQLAKNSVYDTYCFKDLQMYDISNYLSNNDIFKVSRNRINALKGLKTLYTEKKPVYFAYHTLKNGQLCWQVVALIPNKNEIEVYNFNADLSNKVDLANNLISFLRKAKQQDQTELLNFKEVVNLTCQNQLENDLASSLFIGYIQNTYNRFLSDSKESNLKSKSLKETIEAGFNNKLVPNASQLRNKPLTKDSLLDDFYIFSNIKNVDRDRIIQFLDFEIDLYFQRYQAIRSREKLLSEYQTLKLTNVKSQEYTFYQYCETALSSITMFFDMLIYESYRIIVSIFSDTEYNTSCQNFSRQFNSEDYLNVKYNNLTVYH